MKNSERAVALFLEGYNCAQAVLGAFSGEIGLSEKMAMRLACPFGGGVGRLREICGACSGMLLAAGALYGYDTPETGEVKSKHYQLVRELCAAFKEQNSSIICREILGKRAEVGGTPEPRTESFYKERPCVKCIRTAAEILEKYLAENPVSK